MHEAVAVLFLISQWLHFHQDGTGKKFVPIPSMTEPEPEKEIFHIHLDRTVVTSKNSGYSSVHST